MARKKKRKSLTGFPLADKALGTMVGGITTGMAIDQMKAVGGVAAQGTPVLGASLLVSTMPKRRKRKRKRR